jgi:hypothetical protein
MNATNEVEYDCSEKKDVDIVTVTNEELTSQHAVLDAIEAGDHMVTNVGIATNEERTYQHAVLDACAPSLPPSHSTVKANDGVQHSLVTITHCYFPPPFFHESLVFCVVVVVLVLVGIPCCSMDSSPQPDS